MAQQIKTKVEVAGKELSFFSSLRIDQYIDWHHSFELRVPVEELEGKNNHFIGASADMIGKEMKVNVQSKFGDQGKAFFKGIITEIFFSKHHGYIQGHHYKRT